MAGSRSNALVLLGLSAVAVAAGATAYWAYGVAQREAEASPVVAEAPARPSVDQNMLGEPRPAFTLPDLDGVPQDVAQWDGKVLLINFWATWCPPCRKEMPAFIELHERYSPQGFEIVGVAIDDASTVRDFVDTLGVNYPIVVGELDASEISRRYGNHFGALPYSVLVDREGKIRFIKPGELTRDVLEKELQRLL